MAVPADKALTTPVELTPATAGGVILQVPPGTELLNVTELPTQTGAFPVIKPGMALTVIATVAVPQAIE